MGKSSFHSKRKIWSQDPWTGQESSSMAKLGDKDLSAKREGMARLGVSRNDSPFVFCSVCRMFLEVFRPSLQVCKQQAVPLEKIAFWAIIEGPFAGYAFRGVNGCCMGFGFWGKKIVHGKMVDSQTPKQK